LRSKNYFTFHGREDSGAKDQDSSISRDEFTKRNVRMLEYEPSNGFMNLILRIKLCLSWNATLREPGNMC
jgi:hypothetical protein